MKHIGIFAAVVSLIFIESCYLPSSSNPYLVELSLSLGTFSKFPPGADYQDLGNYLGKQVYFYAFGLDEGVNTDVVMGAVEPLAWMGGNTLSATQEAAHAFSLRSTKDGYRSGMYGFLIFIDWDGDATLGPGDVIMRDYALTVSYDTYPDTPGEILPPASYDDLARYNSVDHSLIVEDPCIIYIPFKPKVERIQGGVLGLE
jgi:hypothetical protein